jgi:hypothetical protein
VPGALRAIDTASGDRHEMRVPSVERSIFEQEQHILLDPKLQAPDGKQDAFGLAVTRPAPVFAEASRERFILLVGWQLRQQEGMANTDFVAVEGFDNNRNEVHQLETGYYKGWRFAGLCGDLLDGVGRIFQVQQGFEPLRLLHWVYVGADKVISTNCASRA